MISVRQIHPLFAAEVTGVDLAALTPDQVATLQDASNRHAVLVFPGQTLNDDDLLTLGRLFGDVEPPRNHRVQQRLKHAELADISNLTATNELRANDDQRRLDSLGNRLWHSDASFREVPGALSMLFAHIVPPAGGETEFADLRAAYDALAPEMKTKIESLVCEHSIFHSRGQLGHQRLHRRRARRPPAGAASVGADTSGITAQNALHGLARLAHRGLADARRASAAARPDGARDAARIRLPPFEWRVGDLVMWDNRCTLHRGRAYDDAAHPRDLRRVTTKDHYAAA